jgi:hypothetical protein
MNRRAAIFVALALLAARAARAGDWDLQLAPPMSVPTPVVDKPRLMDDKLQNWTIGIMAGTVVALIAWDVIVAKEGSSTESQLLKNFAWQYSVIPYILGILIGHWFFNHEGSWNQSLWPVAFGSIGIVLTWDLLKPHNNSKGIERYPGIWFAVGVPMGAVFWGQRH